MEFITHLPTTSIFVINMITFFLVTIGLAAFGNLLALVLPTRQDRTWEKLAQVIEVEPEVEPVSEFAFSEAALALFEEVQGLAEGRVSPPPHLPENLKGVPRPRGTTPRLASPSRSTLGGGRCVVAGLSTTRPASA
jgi:hypothetical protein